MKARIMIILVLAVNFGYAKVYDDWGNKPAEAIPLKASYLLEKLPAGYISDIYQPVEKIGATAFIKQGILKEVIYKKESDKFIKISQKTYKEGDSFFVDPSQYRKDVVVKGSPEVQVIVTRYD